MSDLHLCVGVYLDNSFKTNTVSTGKLENNIEVNRIYRPGRFYFVDGKYVCGGLLKEPYKTEFITRWEAHIKELGLKPDPVESYEFE